MYQPSTNLAPIRHQRGSPDSEPRERDLQTRPNHLAHNSAAVNGGALNLQTTADLVRTGYAHVPAGG
jgi:hypothetical protein